MAGRFEDIDDFEIPSELFDYHEWMSDSLIDGQIGVDCTLYYPPSDTECPNCLFDVVTGRSADVYKTGGPYPFEIHTTCPLCGGFGKGSIAETDTLRLRVYFGRMEVNAAMRQFANVNLADAPNGVIFVIGYMEDRPKYIRANGVTIPNQEEIRCKRISEAQPWGFRKNRYFAAMLGRQ